MSLNHAIREDYWRLVLILTLSIFNWPSSAPPKWKSWVYCVPKSLSRIFWYNFYCARTHPYSISCIFQSLNQVFDVTCVIQMIVGIVPNTVLFSLEPCDVSLLKRQRWQSHSYVTSVMLLFQMRVNPLRYHPSQFAVHSIYNLVLKFLH